MSDSLPLHADGRAVTPTRAAAHESLSMRTPGAARATSGGPADRAPADREVPAAHDAPLDATRIAVIRERYARGAYDTIEVVEEVARRLLKRGEV